MATVDDCRRMLDNGWTVMMRRNDLGSYTAVAIAPDQDVDEALDIERQITDDFMPSKVLCRLSEKMIGNIVSEGETPPAPPETIERLEARVKAVEDRPARVVVSGGPDN